MMCICLALLLAPCDVGDVCIVCWPSEEKKSKAQANKNKPRTPALVRQRGGAWAGPLLSPA